MNIDARIGRAITLGAIALALAGCGRSGTGGTPPTGTTTPPPEAATAAPAATPRASASPGYKDDYGY